MIFNSIEKIKIAGFSGFKNMKELFKNNTIIPEIKGVYMILNPTMNGDFLTDKTEGYFPGISPAELKENWVDGAIVVCIGKAGKEGGRL